jgi:hypothetical protein
MSLMNRNTLSFRAGGSPEDLEVLLRNYFRSEIPDPWPTMKAPVARVAPPPARSVGRWAPVRSRLALAASVGFLMVGSWCLSSRLENYNPGTIDAGMTGPNTADTSKRLKPLVKPGAPAVPLAPSAK